MSDAAAETAPVDAAPVEAEVAPAEEVPSTLDIDQNEIIFGVACLAGLVQGYMMYDWYPKMVKDNNTLYPDRDPNPNTYTNNENEEWALGTKEIRAWNNAAMLNLGWYGANMLAWGLNLALDNEGGRLHFVSQKLRQLTGFAVLLQIGQAVNVNIAYVRSSFWFVNAVDDGQVVGSNNVNIDERLWLFNPGNYVSGQFDSHDEKRLEHEQQLWISIFLIAGALAAVSAPLTEKYDLALYEAELAAWEELYGDSEDDAVEESSDADAADDTAAAPEEQFF